MKKITVTMMGIVFIAAALSSSYAADYSYSSPAYPGALFTIPYGVNDAGMVVGYYDDVNGVQHGFTLSGTTYTSLDYPDALFTVAYGVNDAGTVVGYYEDANQVDHGFTVSSTNFYNSYTPVDYPGALFTIAYGISSAGTVVGYYEDAMHQDHGFTLTGTTYTSFDFPGAALLAAYHGINNAGTIAVWWADVNWVQHGSLLNGGTATSFDYPGSSFTVIRGINDVGTTVGFYGDAYGLQHGFTLSGTSYTPINYPGALFTMPLGINAAGSIVGYFGNANGWTQGFLAVPDTTAVNGACGSANNGVVTSAPSANLCGADNTPSSVSGTGPWTWTCQGSTGSVTVSCRAAKAAGTLTVIKNGTSSETVTSSRSGIDCGLTCAAPFPEGFVTLTAAPAANFLSWVGCTTALDNICILDLTASDSITANFASSAHFVTYNGNTSSGGSVPVDGQGYANGATVTVLGNAGALVKTNASFAGWNTSGNGSGITYGAGSTFLMGSADVTLYALWAAPVRILGGNSYFQTLTDAYSAAKTGDTIQATCLNFFPGLILTRNIAITLNGGYDANFWTNVGFSALKGRLTITNGTVRVKKIVIRPQDQ